MTKQDLKSLIKETLDEMAKEKTTKIKSSQLLSLVAKKRLGFVHEGDLFPYSQANIGSGLD
jgi:hypothetical protein